MIFLPWLFADPVRVIPTSIVVFVLFVSIQLMLCVRSKRKTAKIIPLCFVFVLSLLDMLLALGVFGAESEGFVNVYVFMAMILAVPLSTMYIGIFVGWLIAVFCKKRMSKY